MLRFAASLVLATALLCLPALAMDAPPAPEVAHSAWDIALDAGALPEGWTLAQGDGGAGAEALKKEVEAIAKEAGLPADALTALARTATAKDGTAVFLLVDMETPKEAFRAALDGAAGAKGWAVREMGANTRLLVVAAPEAIRAKAVELQTAWAAKMLGTKALSSLQYRIPHRALAFAHAAIQIDPKAAGGNLVMGMMIGYESLQTRPPQAAGLERAIALLRRAVAADAVGPLAGVERATAQGVLGGFLLNQGGPSAEARDALKEAVKGGEGADRSAMLGWRYNLACAHARLKEIEEAFPILTAVLADHAAQPVEGLSHWREDPDFESLKADARWARLLEKYPPSAGPMGE